MKPKCAFPWLLGLAALGLAGLAQAVTCQDGIPAGNPDSVYVADLARGTVIDARTGLMWKTCVEGQTWDGATCVGDGGTYTWSEALALAETAAFAGHDDWRLPNYKELLSLVEPCRTFPSINDTLFPNTPGSHVWSGSPSANISDFAWYVSFSGGYADGSLRSSSYLLDIRLVRTSQSSGTFTLKASKAGTGAGTVTSTPAGINCGTTCAANFPAGTASVTLAASAADGSTFTGWSANCAPLAADPRQCTVTVTTPQTVIATFSAAPASYSLSINKVGNGTVTSSPAGIDCGTGSGCTASFASGTGVTLTATPDSGYTFTGWGGAGCAGTGPCTVRMTAAQNVTATFAASGAQTIGPITLDPAGLIVGGSARVTATASSGLPVTLGTQTPAICTLGGTASGATVTGVTAGTCLLTADQPGDASFQPAPRVTLAVPVVVQPRVGGTLTLDLTPYGCPTVPVVTSLTPTVCQVASVESQRALIALNTVGACQIDVACGTEHVQPPIPWIDKGVPPPIQTAMGGAVGDPIPIPQPEGLCATAPTLTSLTPTICRVSGDTVTLDAIGTCRVLAERAETADCQAARDELVIEVQQYVFALTASVTGQGRIASDPPGIACGTDCAEDYLPGTVVTLTATPATGWRFLGWGGACTGSAATCALTMDGARAVTANFAALANRFQLDSPVNDSPESGIGVVSGWVCEASRVTAQVDDRAPFEVAHGAASAASASICGDSANGFAAAINWSDYGDGAHTLTLLADGVALTTATVTVTTLGTDYARGLGGQTTVSDFPAAGLDTVLTWSEPHQNFLVGAPAPAPAGGIAAPLAIAGNWESPLPGGHESGRSLLRGWACAAATVATRLDGGTLLEVPHGSARNDTESVCGDTDNGYAVAMDWSALGDGTHRIDLLIDGAVAETRNLTVTTPGGRGTVSGVQRRHTVNNFPAPGRQAILQWSEPAQNFRIVALRRTVAVPDIAGAAGSARHFRIQIPAHATDVRVTTSGGGGNVDLHVQPGQRATPSTALCHSTQAGTAETCVLTEPVTGDLYVLLNGVTEYAEVTLEVSWQP